jgi:hypothetical protein
VVADAKSAGDRRYTARLNGAKDTRYVYVITGSESGIGGPYVTKVR